MRPIKFRAWDKELNKYVREEILKDFRLDYLQDTHYIFEQFTGLHDKNGKDIYEGDRIECAFASGKEECVVVFEKACFWVSQRELPEFEGCQIAFDNLHWHAEDSEVIGNIHENGDLL